MRTLCGWISVYPKRALTANNVIQALDIAHSRSDKLEDVKGTASAAFLAALTRTYAVIQDAAERAYGVDIIGAVKEAKT
jgi:hypothetical protein